MVIYRTADGQPGYHQTDELDEAVGFVEQLRNSDGVDHARIFRMEEVVFDFKPYYKVEVGNETMTVAPQAAPAPAPAPAFAPAPVEERGGWLDRAASDRSLLAPEPAPEPVIAEPVLAEPVIAEPVMAEPVLADTPLLAPEPVAEVDAEPEPAAVLDSIPPPPPPPAVENDADMASNGMGARRGLFGR